MAVICPGLHCPCCTGRQSAGVLVGVVVAAYVADQLCAWVAERIWWIGGTLAACFLLAAAASMRLEALADRRGRAWGAAHGIYSRADVIRAGHPEVPAVTATAIPHAQTPATAIEHHHHGPVFNFYGPDAEAAAARVIRQSITEGDQ